MVVLVQDDGSKLPHILDFHPRFTGPLRPNDWLLQWIYPGHRRCKHTSYIHPAGPSSLMHFYEKANIWHPQEIRMDEYPIIRRPPDVFFYQ